MRGWPLALVLLDAGLVPARGVPATEAGPAEEIPWALSACRTALYDPAQELRFTREGRSEEYRLQFAGKAARQVCASARRARCRKFHRAVDAALLAGLLRSYDSFCDDVFGDSPFRPLFDAARQSSDPGATDARGQRACEAAVSATQAGAELATPHVLEYAAFAVCMDVPEGWRLPHKKAPAAPPAKPEKAKVRPANATKKAALLAQPAAEDAWPWELPAPAFWQRGQNFWRRKRHGGESYTRGQSFWHARGSAAPAVPAVKAAAPQVSQPSLNPFQAAWQFAHAPKLRKTARAQGTASAPAASAPRAAPAPNATALVHAEKVRSGECLTFQKFVGQLVQSGDLGEEDFCTVLSPHYAAARPSGRLRPESPAVQFRGTPLGMCVSRLAQAPPNSSLSSLAAEMCSAEVESLAPDLRIDCSSFADFVGFLDARGEVSRASFCSLLAPDWGTFAAGGSFAYDKCLQVVPSVLSMDVSTEVMASTLFDVCATTGGEASKDEKGFAGARVARALGCAPLRRAVLDLRPLGLLLPETACHALSANLHPDTFLFDTCGARLESVAGLQTLTTAQQADLIEQDCLQDAASSIRGAPGKDEAAKPKVCAWVRQTFLDLSSQSPRVSGNMLCSLMEDTFAAVKTCTDAMATTFKGQDAAHKVPLAEQECLQLTADGPLCAQLGTLFAAGVAKGVDVEPQMVCAELMTGEGETDRRLWVRSCARELQGAEDRGLPRSALCFEEPLAAHQQACERVLSATEIPRSGHAVCETIWSAREERQCLLSPWSEWAACSSTCGDGGVRTRRRLVLHEAGSACAPHALTTTEACSLEACSDAATEASALAAPPALLVPTAGRSSTGLWVTWVLPELHGLDGHRASPLTKLTLVVTQDGGGEVFRKELPASRDGSARQLQVGGLEASTRYSAQLLGEYAATLPNPLQDSRDAGLRRVVAFTRSDQNVVTTLEPPRCVQTDCGANGLCLQGECVCAAGWTGDRCETRMRLPQILWRAERWSACAADCDGGTQVRSVHCVRSANSERSPAEDAERRPDYECGLDSRPPTVRPCRASPCGSWRRTVDVELGDAALAYVTSHLADRADDFVQDLESGIAASLGVERASVTVLHLGADDAFAALERTGGLLEGAAKDSAASADDDEDEDDDALPADEKEADAWGLEDDGGEPALVQSFLQTRARVRRSDLLGVELAVEIIAPSEETVDDLVQSFAAQLRTPGAPLLVNVPLLRRAHASAFHAAAPVQLALNARALHLDAPPALDAHATAEAQRAAEKAAEGKAETFTKEYGTESEQLLGLLHTQAQVLAGHEAAEVTLHAKAAEVLVGKENATAARNRFGHGDASSAENGALAPKQPGGAGWMLRAGKDAGAATALWKTLDLSPAVVHGRALWTHGSGDARRGDEIFRASAPGALALFAAFLLA